MYKIQFMLDTEQTSLLLYKRELKTLFREIIAVLSYNLTKPIIIIITIIIIIIIIMWGQ
jgi:hypothetical protein